LNKRQRAEKSGCTWWAIAAGAAEGKADLMNLRYRFASTPSAHHMARVLTAAGLILAGASAGWAQTPPAKQQPKQPQAQPAQPPQGQPAPQAQVPQEMPPAVYTPWTKLCNPNASGAKPICLTIKEARLSSGEFLAGAAVLEQEGEQLKLLRVTLPLGMQLGPGTRVIVDQDQPLSSNYLTCTPAGCMAQYQVSAEFVTKLKTGKQMTVQGINLQGQAASYPIPLGAEFAKANEGPPVDPKQLEQTQGQQPQPQQQKR
jgi:invasion protein IalB